MSATLLGVGGVPLGLVVVGVAGKIPIFGWGIFFVSMRRRALAWNSGIRACTYEVRGGTGRNLWKDYLFI